MPNLIRYIFIILIFCSLVILLIHLGSKPFWIDESITVMPSAKILETGVPYVSFDCNFMPWQIKNNIWDPATPLYRYALSFFIRLFGLSEFSARLFSVICGLLLIYTCYVLFRIIYGEKIALISVTLISTSAVFIKYAREARYFTFLMLFVVLTLYFLYRAINSSDKKSRLLWPFFMLMAILTHSIGFLVIPVVAVYLLLNIKRIHFKKYDYIIFIIIFIGYFPIFLRFYDTLPFFIR